MATTTKKTTATTAKKTTTKRTSASKSSASKQTDKPKLEIVKEETAIREATPFEMMAARFPFTVTEVDLGEGLKVNVRNRLGLGEMMMVVDSIVRNCVDEDKGEIRFDIFDYATKLTICSVYCNIPAPENQEIGYAAVSGQGGMFDRIKGYIDPVQLGLIYHSAKEKIDSKRELFNSAAAKITVDMLSRLNELFEMISNVTDDFNGEEAVDAIKMLRTLATGK